MSRRLVHPVTMATSVRSMTSATPPVNASRSNLFKTARHARMMVTAVLSTSVTKGSVRTVAWRAPHATLMVTNVLLTRVTRASASQGQSRLERVVAIPPSAARSAATGPACAFRLRCRATIASTTAARAETVTSTRGKSATVAITPIRVTAPFAAGEVAPGPDCRSDADCPRLETCAFRECQHDMMKPGGARCVKKEPADPSCKPCSVDAHCYDGDPCTYDSCGVASGDNPLQTKSCRKCATETGLFLATCALPYSPLVNFEPSVERDACSNHIDSRFVDVKLTPALGLVTKRLVATCPTSTPPELGRRAQEKVRRALRRAEGKLFRIKSTLVLTAASFTPNSKRLSGSCAVAIGGRLDKAQDNLRRAGGNLGSFCDLTVPSCP